MLRFKYDEKTSGVQCHCDSQRYFVIKDSELCDEFVAYIMSQAVPQADGTSIVNKYGTGTWFDLMGHCEHPITVRRVD